jgi:hypothetical protein
MIVSTKITELLALLNITALPATLRVQVDVPIIELYDGVLFKEYKLLQGDTVTLRLERRHDAPSTGMVTK